MVSIAAASKHAESQAATPADLSIQAAVRVSCALGAARKLGRWRRSG
jgi:hypothetical protein